MRILHTGDWHLGKNLEGQSRMDEQELFLNDFIEIVERQDVDLVIIAGDVAVIRQLEQKRCFMIH